MAGVVSDVISEIGEEKVLALISDNASNMTSTWTLVQNSFPQPALITCYSCCAHTLNLLAADILKLSCFETVSVKCKNIVKAIKKSHILNATFGDIQSSQDNPISLKLPASTRWGSMCICLESLKINKRNLQELAINTTVADILAKHRKLKNYILSDKFWDEVDLLYNILSPISKYTIEVQTSKPYISNVVEIFYNLQKEYSELRCESVKNSLLEFLKNRKSMAIFPIHMAANLLDPYFQGSHLQNDEYLQALNYISKISTHLVQSEDLPAILREVANYKAKSDIFMNEFVWQSLAHKKLDPVVWWKSICATTALSKVAVQILNCPASTAATERSFSVYGNIHTKLRNRLTNVRASKLVFVKSNLELSQRQCEKSRKTNSRKNMEILKVRPGNSDSQNIDEDSASVVSVSDSDTDISDLAEVDSEGEINEEIRIIVETD